METEQPAKQNGKSGKKVLRGVETLFRVTLRNQMDLIGIADKKSNLILSINTILISIIVGLFSSSGDYTNWFVMDKAILLLPLSILIVFSLSSAVLAILAARPTIVRDTNNKKYSSALFFANYANQTIENYIDQIKEITGSNDEIYKNLTIDMYNLGQVLNKKYKYLYWAYSLFMVGIIACVVAYFINISLQQ